MTHVTHIHVYGTRCIAGCPIRALQAIQTFERDVERAGALARFALHRHSSRTRLHHATALPNIHPTFVVNKPPATTRLHGELTPHLPPAPKPQPTHYIAVDSSYPTSPDILKPFTYSPTSPRAASTPQPYNDYSGGVDITYTSTCDI